MTLDEAVAAAFALAEAAVASGRIPCAVLGAIDADGRRTLRAAGHAMLVPERVAATPDTIFDLASLSKVIFTTTEILRLVEEGRIALDDPLAKAIPDLRQYDVSGAPERKLTFRQCLAHQTHLPAVEPIYTLSRDPATLKAHVLQNPWRAGPPVYSDINFILLGIAIERLRGRALAELAVPEGLTFRPDPSRCAATERCTWRERIMRGQVHDENAFALGGVAGHAGLFGTIDGVLGFAHALLAGTVLQPDSIAALRTRNAPTRTLGWETKHEGWHGGAACSDETIGHTGFTGTGLWIDWRRRVAWALLTNRVHPTRHVETGIQELRRTVGEHLIAAWDR